MKKCLFLVLLFLTINICIKAQLTLTVQSKINTVCNGNPCNYSGPSILINEVMLSPLVGDGSIYDNGLLNLKGEWIELYNPDQCKPVDISCYYLGNNAPDPYNYSGGFRLPPHTIVPARGFAVIRGTNAPPVPSNLLVKNGGRTVEIVATDSMYNVGNICIGFGGERLWFPNAGGWFAFYNKDGVPQDAISWNLMTNSCTSCQPCVSACATCPNAAYLPSYDDIPTNLKTYITYQNPGASYNLGLSWRRIPDGGPWSSNCATPTEGTCNSTCNPAPVITCNGMAWVNVSGGTPPYTYQWDDERLTTKDTANGLCAGIYHVTVTDSRNVTAIKSVQVNNVELETTISATNPACYGNNDGSAAVTPHNGTTPYTYSWNNGKTTSAINNLPPGNYSVTVTDNKGCTDTLSKSIIQPPQLSVEAANIKQIMCNGDSTGSINVKPSGGTSPYSFAWNTIPPQSSGNPVNLPAGKYTVTVTDNNGCKDTLSVTLTQPQKLNITIHKTKDKLCFEDTMNVDAIASNGIQPYTYIWYPGNYITQSIILTNNQDTLTQHNISVTVFDHNNCKNIATSSITYLPPIKIQVTADSICPGNCNGYIILKVKDSNGNTDFNGNLCNYSWSNQEYSKDDTLLCPGTYKVNITDQNNCMRVFDALNIAAFFPADTSNDVSPIEGYSPLNVNFVYKGKDKNIKWIFGDSKQDSSSQKNVTHKYMYVVKQICTI